MFYMIAQWIKTNAALRHDEVDELKGTVFTVSRNRTLILLKGKIPRSERTRSDKEDHDCLP